MRIKLSKSQWEEVGRKAGWFKTAQNTQIDQNIDDHKIEEYYFKGWDAKIENAKGEWKILAPEMKTSILGRAFLRGWHDCNLKEHPIQIPSNLVEIVKSNTEMTINGDIIEN